MPDAAPLPKGIAEVANEGGLLPAQPEDQDVSKLPPSTGTSFALGTPALNNAYKAELQSKFPTTYKSFVGTKAIDLSPEQTQKALQAGTIKIPINQDLHLKLPDGSYKVVPAGQINQAFADNPGSALVSANEHHLADLHASNKTALGGAEAGGLGLARGLSTVAPSGSISDELVSLFGPEAQEKAETLKEDRPTISGLSTAGGQLLQSMVMPGGGIGGLAEKGAAAVVGHEAPGFIAGLAQRVAPLAIRAGAENAAIGHAQAISEDALGGAVSEKYYAERGEDILWGTLLGGAGAVAGEGAAALGRGVKSGASKLLDNLRGSIGAPTEKSVEEFAEKTFGGPIAEGVGKDVLHPEVASEAQAAARNEVRVQAQAKLNEDLAALERETGTLERGTPTKVKLTQEARTAEEVAEYLKAHIQDKDVQAFINNPKVVPDSIKFKTVESAGSAEVNKEIEQAREAFKAAKDKLQAASAANPDLSTKYVQELINPKIDPAHQLFTDYVQSAKNLAGALKVKPALAAAKAAEKTLTDVAPKIMRVNQIEALLKAGAAKGESLGDLITRASPSKWAVDKTLKVIGTAVGHAIGGPLGGFIGYGMGKASSRITELASVQEVMSTFDGKIAKAVDSFFAHGDRPVAIEARAPTTFGKAVKQAGRVNRGRKTAERESTREAYERQVEQVRALQNPSVVAARLQPHIDALQAPAPKMAGQLGSVATRAIAFLSGVIPQTTSDPLTGKQETPSMSDMLAFNLKVQVVKHPETVVDDLARGRVTAGQVATLKAVYPEIFKEVQTKVQAALADHVAAGKPISFQQRVNLGILMDLPTDDPSLAKPAIGHANATFSAPPTPAPGEKGSGPSPAAEKASVITTPEQKLSQGSPGL